MRFLLGVGLAHAVLAAVCLVLLRFDAAPILGVHPALKPLKFASSIALFLLTMWLLLPALSISETTRRVLAATLSLTMLVETVIISAQAIRGQRSHFNGEHPLMIRVMLLGVGVMLVAMVSIAIVATVRPLVTSSLMATAWRASLWIFLFAGVSGVSMGGRGAHTVGAPDGGVGMAVTNWSTTHGDLRVSHFFALHALQIIPLLAFALSRIPIPTAPRWSILILGIVTNAVLAGWTFIQALASRPL